MQNSQQGRTLIETLAILATIGILSVIGLQLYIKAMNTIRANYIMKQVFIKANEFIEDPVANRPNRGKMVDVSIYKGESLSYGFSFCAISEACAPRREGNKIVIQINGFFPVGLCKILKNKIQFQEYSGLKNIKANSIDLVSNSCPTDFDITSMTFIVDTEFKKQTF